MKKIIGLLVVASMFGVVMPTSIYAQSSEGSGVSLPIPRTGGRSGVNRVTALFAPPTTAQVGVGQVLGDIGFRFDTSMSVGATGNEVTELQKRLKAEGFFSIEPTGYFGEITLAAVKAYQTAHGIPNTGYVGTLTMGQLNSNIAVAPVESAEVATLKTQVVGLIKQAIGLLQAQLASVISAGNQ